MRNRTQTLLSPRHHCDRRRQGTLSLGSRRIDRLLARTKSMAREYQDRPRCHSGLSPIPVPRRRLLSTQTHIGLLQNHNRYLKDLRDPVRAEFPRYLTSQNHNNLPLSSPLDRAYQTRLKKRTTIIMFPPHRPHQKALLGRQYRLWDQYPTFRCRFPQRCPGRVQTWDLHLQAEEGHRLFIRVHHTFLPYPKKARGQDLMDRMRQARLCLKRGPLDHLK